MKKVFLIFACACLLSACGGGGSSETTNDTIISPELNEIQKSADEVKAKSEDLNQKADSLLNNI